MARKTNRRGGLRLPARGPEWIAALAAVAGVIVTALVAFAPREAQAPGGTAPVSPAAASVNQGGAAAAGDLVITNFDVTPLQGSVEYRLRGRIAAGETLVIYVLATRVTEPIAVFTEGPAALDSSGAWEGSVTVPDQLDYAVRAVGVTAARPCGAGGGAVPIGSGGIRLSPAPSDGRACVGYDQLEHEQIVGYLVADGVNAPIVKKASDPLVLSPRATP